MQKHYQPLINSQELLTTPSSIFSRLIADVQHARETIDMEYYIFSEDRIGRAFTELLGRKARQGLRVRLLVDGFGSRRMSRRQREKLRMAGVDVKTYRLSGHRRNHRKMAIIDGCIAHVGGANIADRYVVGNSLGMWHDVQLRFVRDGVVALMSLFDYDYLMADGLKCEIPMCYTTPRLSLVWSESQGRRAMPQLFEDMVSTARREIVLMTPYYMPPESVVASLADAVARGVKVRLFVPARCGMWLVDNIMRYHISEAQRIGVDVQLCRNMFIHAKMSLVDRQRVIVGSANLDSRSMYINRELMAVSSSRDVTDAATSFVDRISGYATPPVTEELRVKMPRFVGRVLEHVL